MSRAGEIYSWFGRRELWHRDLLPIRRYAAKHGVKEVQLHREQGSTGQLRVIYSNDGQNGEISASFAHFASYSVLLGFVRRWRTVYGTKLVISGEDCGTVSYQNKELQKDFEAKLLEVWKALQHDA